MLRLNQQVHDEAWTIFARENNWITITINKLGYGAEMKKRGFGVVYCGKLDHITSPVLKVSIEFPSLRSRREKDTFAMTAAGLNRLPRALWTTVGMREMELRLELHPLFATVPAKKEDEVLNCFYQLRGIRKVTLKGGNQKKHKQMIPTELIRPHDDADDISRDLKLVVQFINEGWKSSERQELAELAESTIAFLSDCFKVYGNQFMAEDGKVFEAIAYATIRLAEGIAQARMELHEHRSVIKYATYAMCILPITRKRRASLLILRGEAHGAIGENMKQMRNLLEAQELTPNDQSVTKKFVALKKSLHPDPLQAFARFTELRSAVKREEKLERQELNQKLKGKLAFRQLPYGGFVMEDHTKTSRGT